MATIIPVRDMKDTAKISQLVHEVDEPVHITKNGYSDMVIMSTEVYEREFFYKTLHEKLAVGEAAIAAGDTVDARNAVKKIRDTHGL
jgi:PHD/YefM family antitoxin component YafN of YafNO toxin-antitoxin module